MTDEIGLRARRLHELRTGWQWEPGMRARPSAETKLHVLWLRWLVRRYGPDRVAE